MKKHKYIIITFLMIFLSSITTKAQVRPDIYDFTPSQRTELANLIIDFVTPEILQLHCDYTTYMGVGTTQYNIHDNFNFLPFHRTYLERLEDWLISQGHPEYVPLPKWTGLVAPPTEFSTAGPNGNGVSPACGTTTCANAPEASVGCDPTDWNGTLVNLPSYLTIPGGLCSIQYTPLIYTTDNDESGSNGLSRRIEGPWHNNGHNVMRGVMWNFCSPAATIFWLWHAAVDDKWKEWEEHCTNQPSNTTLPVDLYMKDNPFVVEYYRDRGEEPNIDDGPMWVSRDIWVRNQPDGVLNQTHQNPEYGQVNYIYVRVRNRGYQTSLGSEQLNLLS